ncbi:MAG: Fic family protein [Polyangiaceae bacterium]|nr:Fic family protein [Polyangiaceae bacterium]
MASRATGHLERTSVAGAPVSYFVPLPLPPTEPALRIDGVLAARLDAAERALGRLALAAELAAPYRWVARALLREEAVRSAQIEGGQATLFDVYAAEAAAEADTGRRADPDVEEVCHAVVAASHAHDELRSAHGRPLSLRLLHETQALLVPARGARASAPDPFSGDTAGAAHPRQLDPGPRPPRALAELLDAFERYLQAEPELPPLVRAGLLALQLETIHPYRDGNARMARLLVPLLLQGWALLGSPLLCLSRFFQREREAYYGRAAAVRTDGDWEGWLELFLGGVATAAHEGSATVRDVLALVARDRERLFAEHAPPLLALRLFEALPDAPVCTIASAVRRLDTTKPAAGRAVDLLVRAGVLVETTGRKHGRTFAYRALVEALTGAGEPTARPRPPR